MKDLRYEGVGFNVDFVNRFTAADDFAKDKTNNNLWPKLDQQLRNQRLKEVWKLARLINMSFNKK